MWVQPARSKKADKFPDQRKVSKSEKSFKAVKIIVLIPSKPA